jgi:glycogen debranching enzyme
MVNKQTLTTHLPKLPPRITLPSLALLSVTSRSGMGVYASSDTLYKGAVFGRDSLEVAEDLMELKPRLVRNILLTLASLQGTRTDKIKEEEPGKIIHEYRTVEVDGKAISGMSLRIFKELSNKWGGSDQEMAYYGSVDATPHFLRVLGQYCEENTKAILDEEVTLNNGNSETVRNIAFNAVEWIIEKLAESKSGLLEYHKQNPHGISNQVWKDSEEFYVHSDGQPVNHNLPIASIEVQALVYDGLIAASKILDKTIYVQQAEKVRDLTIKKLWLLKEKYFALGLDYTENNEERVIKTLTANQGALLDSGFFDNLDPNISRIYITAIVRTIMSQDFLTDAGIRSRALKEAALVNHWDYHGSFVTWSKESYDIAKGLRRHGFPLLSKQIENRILNVCLRYKAYPEFVYVDSMGRVLASPPSSRTHGDFMMVEATNTPERIQAWTVSAVMSIVSRRLKAKLSLKPKTKNEQWQSHMDKQMYSLIPHVDRFINPITLRARYPSYFYKLRNKQ